MTKARTLADFISDGSPLADGTISVSEVSGAAPLANPTFTGTASGTFSGPLTGAVTGNVTGDLTGNVTGNVTGDLTGNVTAPFVSLVGTLPTLDFSAMLLQVAVGQATDPVAVGTWFDSTASDGYKYGDLDKSGSIGAYDGLLMNQLSAGIASEAVTSRWNNILVPSLVTQSWYADLVADGTVSEGGTLDLTNGWTIEQEAGNLHVSKGNVTKLDISSAGTTTSNQYLLDNIAKDITDTAVDVFVYDTSKDSDGGAWRKRTQGTSWYNETLNTVTRGSRKEFPAVAVIVVGDLAGSSIMQIYDGDDPDLPLWMSFNASGSYENILGSAIGTCVSAVNGVVGFGSTSHDFHTVDFIKDYSFRYGTVSKPYLGTIGQRNDTLGFGESTTPTIINRAVNDVAMTVLPNAPIDSATGLPVPTIAVATEGGVSVIKDDGTVVDITESSGPDSTHAIEFTNDNKIVFMWSDTSGIDMYPHIGVMPIPSSDESSSYYYSSTFIEEDYSYLSSFTNANEGPVVVPNANHLRDFSALSPNKSVGYDSGLSHIYSNPTDARRSMVAYTTSDYNTGWMNGDIKLATLSDTDDTDVTGSELVTNGTFDTDTSGWTPAFSNISVTGGTLQVVGTSNFNYATQTVTGLTVGKKYVFQADIVTGNGNTYIYVRRGDNGGGITNGSANGVGSYALTFEAPTTSVEIRLYQVYQTTSTFDNVSIRLAEEDRSVNGNGLQVFGTVTKNPVNTGADLVAYSGFSGSNYLEQPYNSDLDFGTGDFCLMGWVKRASGTYSIGVLLGRKDSSNTDGYVIFIDASNNINFYTREGSTNSTLISSSNVSDGVWHHITAVRTSSGTVQLLYVDGKLVQSASVTARNVSNSTAKCRLGLEAENTFAPFTNGSLALWRISATAPSPEQIAKIYEDEKVLFQENAQATLYGSSDAVTALAYDDATELLHVGTSAGRSVFQGLRRVDNTTDAVGAAISASNGLVAED